MSFNYFGERSIFSESAQKKCRGGKQQITDGGLRLLLVRRIFVKIVALYFVPSFFFGVYQ
ncbi:MAG: hypothetical protein FWE67_06090 [Planctomycetaceae bacterium]|nr:hypothetical protein [Planctomycetaceae bacterium]